MSAIHEQILIKAPVDRVYRFMVSPDNWKRYVTSLTAVTEISSPDLHPGTSFRWEYSLLGVNLSGTGRINQNVPNTKFSLSMEGGLALTEVYTFTPTAEGTELTVLIEYETPGKVVELLSKVGVADHLNRKEARHVLERLKNLCEEPEDRL